MSTSVATSALPSKIHNFEVRLPNTYAWYKVSIKDYKDGKLLIEYENNWRNNEWVETNSVRSIPNSFDISSFSPQPGDKIEALTRAFQTEPYGWWEGTMRMQKQVFYLISYTGYEESFNEVVEKETLRPPNTNSCLRNDNLTSSSIGFAPELSSFVSFPDSFASIISSTKVLCISPDLKTNSLKIIGTSDNVKKAKNLIELQLRHETEIAKLRARTAGLSQQLQDEKQKFKESAKVEFQVPVHMIGLVVGKSGSHIQACTKMEGIESIKINQETGQVRILAKTEEQALAAKSKLEFVEFKIEIPSDIVGWVVGKKGKNINEITEKSEVFRILCNKNEDDDKKATISIIGLGDTVDAAKLMLTHHIQYVEEMRKAEQEAFEANKSLQKLRDDFGLNGPRRNLGERSQNREQKSDDVAAPKDATPAPKQQDGDRRGNGNGNRPRARNNDSKAEVKSNSNEVKPAMSGVASKKNVPKK